MKPEVEAAVARAELALEVQRTIDTEIGSDVLRTLIAALRDAERDAAIGRALNRGAAILPEGCSIAVHVERGSGCVEWQDDLGNWHDIDVDADDRLAAEINAAIDIAILTEPTPSGDYQICTKEYP